jgi:hypothetical protein
MSEAQADDLAKRVDDLTRRVLDLERARARWRALLGLFLLLALVAYLTQRPSAPLPVIPPHDFSWANCGRIQGA